MLKLLKQKWWKYLSFLLLFYAISGAMLIPLGPKVSNYQVSLSNDEFRLNVTCLNAHLKQAEESTQVFLKCNDEFVCSHAVTVESDSRLLSAFDLNEIVQIQESGDAIHLVINNDIDGTFFEPEIKLGFQSGIQDTITSDCKPVVQVNQTQFWSFPHREILYESIRNLFLHVPMWFGMVLILLFSLVCSIKYLSSPNLVFDIMAQSAVKIGLVLGFLGLFTGMVWARATWGHPWPNDPRLNGAAVGVLIYVAYLVLRSSINDIDKRARIAGIYNIIAFTLFIVFIFVLPRLTDTLHPGVGGNPAFSKYDLDNTMRAFFYPSVIGFTLLGFWIVSIDVRLQILQLNKRMNL